MHNLSHPLIEIKSLSSSIMALPMPSIFMPPKHPHFSKPCMLIDNKHLQAGVLVACSGSSTNDNGNSSELPLEPLRSTTSAEAYLKSKAPNKLEVGSPIIVTKAPQWIKTAKAISSLRVNSGHINEGDVGRIISRKPKDVWAVRFRIGTYLIDGKYFEALELEEPAV